MISLDKKILEKDSLVAKRMIAYGEKDELFILIPSEKKESFDLSAHVHVQSTGGNKLQQFFRLKKIGKAIIRDNNMGFITTQDPFFLGKVGVWLKKHTRVGKFEVQLHGDFYSSDYYKKSGLKHWIQYQLGKKVLKKADTIRVVGERVKQSVIDLGIHEKKIAVRPIEESRMLDEESNDHLHKKYSEYKKIFLSIGRLEEVKHVGFLVDLWKEIPKDYLLLIVGKGSKQKDLELQAMGKENITFEEWTEDPYGYIKSADCVLFSSYSEGYGLVPMEAHALGTSVIMNDVGVANYELQPSEKVEIIPLSDRQGWIDAILNI